MKTLHLFAGAGGGIIADMMMGHTPVAAVEIDEYCHKVLLMRQKDGFLPQFPIFKDVRDFVYDDKFGMVDCICAGFPCQDISVAGKGLGIAGKKSGLFFELVRIVREIRPDIVFLENSPAIVTRGLNRVLGEMAALGYDAEWCCLSARACGAWHKRDRWWCLCSNANGKRKLQQERAVENFGGWLGNVCQKVSDTECTRLEGFRPKSREETFTEPRDSGLYVSNTTDDRHVWGNWIKEKDRCVGEAGHIIRRGTSEYECGEWWKTEPELGRVVNGVANRVDRLNAIGNGQVPICAVMAYKALSERITND